MAYLRLPAIMAFPVAAMQIYPRAEKLSTIENTSYDRKADRRWTKVALAFLLLLGATVLAAQESHSNVAPLAELQAGQQF